MQIRSYEDARRMAAGRARKLAHNTYLVTDGAPEWYAVRLHSTNVVTYYQDGSVGLDSGGWRTVTTKDRINRFSPLRVWGDKGAWYVALSPVSTCIVAFADEMTWHPERSFTGAGDAKDTTRLRKQAREYAGRYIEALFAGQVPAPSGGDCWGCHLVAEDGSRPMGGPAHILSHFEENYFVPSLLSRAIRNPAASGKPESETPPSRGGGWANRGDYVVSSAALHVLGYLWGHHTQRVEYFEAVARDQLRKALVKYLYRELGV